MAEVDANLFEGWAALLYQDTADEESLNGEIDGRVPAKGVDRG